MKLPIQFRVLAYDGKEWDNPVATHFMYFSEYFSEATEHNDKVPQNNLYWG